MYDHYIAVDWAQSNMAIARMTKESDKIKTVDVRSDLKELKLYLTQARGKKILTFEETTTSQWLYTELRGYVDEILVCDPYRNYLLSEGAKTDRQDAVKLVQLLRAGLLKPVYHSEDKFIQMRKWVSGYTDMVKAVVRLKNQRAALFRGKGQDKREKEVEGTMERFVLEGLEKVLESYEGQTTRYKLEMRKFFKEHEMLRKLDAVPGIGEIGAMKIVAIVVDPKRFKDRSNWLSYLGLVKHALMSGGRSYVRRQGRYCRALKSVFKTAALSVIVSEQRNLFKDYYEHLIKEKNYSEQNARHALARRIATVVWGIFKSGKALISQRRLKEGIKN
ncbi:MAG: transposase [Chlamydiae bacterium]|nr:transposase [Chlamydiota bacterium]